MNLFAQRLFITGLGQIDIVIKIYGNIFIGQKKNLDNITGASSKKR
jgi:hypothetical protein